MTRSSADARIDAALWAAFVLSVALTLVWALGPAPPGARLFPRADKALHAIAFATILGTLLLAAVWRPGRGRGRFPSAGPAFVAMLTTFGVVIELLQSELFGRDADLLDILADVVGMAIALGLVRALGWGRPSRSPRHRLHP